MANYQFMIEVNIQNEFNKNPIEIEYCISHFFQWKCLIGFHNNVLCTIQLANTTPELLTLAKKDFPKCQLIEQELKNNFIEVLNKMDNPAYKFNQSIILTGTEFQNKIWASLLEIENGKTITYSNIATKLQIKNGDRAIGNSIGQNPIAILLPCHRIIGKDGSLKNYKWGIELKKFLLRKEGIKIENSLF